MNRTLRVLVEDIPDAHKWHNYVLMLLPPLVEDCFKMNSDDLSRSTWYNDRRLSECCFKSCLRLLKEGTPIKNTMAGIRSKRIAALIHFCALHPFSNPKDWFTQTDLDLLVDYHLRICKGSDYHAVEHTFTILTWLGGSPSTQDRKCRYIDTTIRFMGREETRESALHAACSVPTALASVDDESLRERFSIALASAIMPYLGGDMMTFNLYYSTKILIPYLRLLYTLSQEPAWQLHLRHNGHFDNCLSIADAL